MKRLAFALVCAFAAAFVGLGASTAHAEDPPPVGYSSGPQPDFGEKPFVEHASPQRWAIELKMTPYTPHIDDSNGLAKGATPFSDLFLPHTPKAGSTTATNLGKQPPYRLLTTVEFDWQIMRRKWGNLGIGLTTGFYRRTTHGFIYYKDPNTGQLSPCSLRVPYGSPTYCVRSGDTTGLNIIPLSALVVYRFETLADRWHIPLVPYVKAGFAYYLWWINDGNGILSAATYPRPGTGLKANSSTGYGGTFGFALNPGIALQLDWIDRSASITMDHELGINHTYLFCELNYANVNGFGARNQLDLSDIMVNSGIGFEF